MKTLKSAALAAALVPLTLSASSFLNDTFNDGDRTTQSLPGSAAWFATHSTVTTAYIVDKGAGEYALGLSGLGTSDSTTRGAVAYFTEPAGNKVTLTAGGPQRTLRSSFDFTPTAATIGNLGHALRFIIANSESGRISTDELGSIIASGYMISMNPGTGEMTFRRRDAVAGNYLSTLTRWVNMDSSQSWFALTGNTTYTLTLEVERLPNDDVQLTATLTDGTTTASTVYVDSAFQTYSFDTIGVSAIGSSVGAVEFDNVKVGFPQGTLTLFYISSAY